MSSSIEFRSFYVISVYIFQQLTWTCFDRHHSFHCPPQLSLKTTVSFQVILTVETEVTSIRLSLKVVVSYNCRHVHVYVHVCVCLSLSLIIITESKHDDNVLYSNPLKISCL